MRPVLLFLAFLTPLVAEPKRIELEFPGLQERVEVVFPDNYDASRTWPAIFYYPGTGEGPDTRLIRHHTGDRDWFVIGMDYVQRGRFTFTRETVADELQIVRSVRQHLSTKYKLDPKRCYLAGFSKGGWISGILLQADRSFAGAAILGAGHRDTISDKPARFPKTTSVFIGVGRLDGNYPFGLRAITWYRGLGASTTFETWHDLGHAFPQASSPALTQWLALRAKPNAKHQADATAWAKKRLEEIDAIPDPVNRWVALRDAESAPYARYLPADIKTRLRAKRTTLEKTATVAIEAKVLAAHRKLLVTEIGEPDRATYAKLAASYYQIHQANPGTRQGEIALADQKRINELLERSTEQDKIRKKLPEPTPPDQSNTPPTPKAPENRPRIPGNPLIR